MTGSARRRAAGAIAAAAILSSVTAGCTSTSSLCGEAAGLLDAGSLARATETYARAERIGAGDCASAGLDAAGARYTDAYANVALGRSAEGSDDVDAAVSAYEAALALDDANPAARDGLTRLGQPVPQLREPDPEPAGDVPGEPRISLVVLVTAAATASACVLLLLLGWALWRWRGRERRRSDAALVASALTDLRHARKAMRDAESAFVEERDTRIGEALEKLSSAHTGLEGAQEAFRLARAGADQDRRTYQDQATAFGEARVQLLEQFTTARTEIAETARSSGAESDQRATALLARFDALADYVGEGLGAPRPVRRRFEVPAGSAPGSEGGG